MARLWVFGDSFSDFYLPKRAVIEKQWGRDYCNWKGYTPKVYSEIIAEKLDLKLINRACGGVDNNYIIEEFTKECRNIKADDVVIFGWTSTARVRLVNRNNVWGYFIPSTESNAVILSGFDFISENTLMEVMLNRSHPNYVVELASWIRLINFSIKDAKIIHWSWDPRLQSSKILIAEEYEKIKEETNGLVNDLHWSESGHQQFAEVLIDEIKGVNKNKNKKLL